MTNAPFYHIHLFAITSIHIQSRTHYSYLSIMSWQCKPRPLRTCGRVAARNAPLTHFAAYVDDQLIATGKVTKGAILGKQGGVWAASAGYEVGPAPVALSLSPFLRRFNRDLKAKKRSADNIHSS